MAQAKHVAQDLRWAPRSNHAGHQVCSAPVFDDGGVAIPGLSVSLEVRAPLVAASCLYQFTLFKLLHGQRRRVYQLEVVPAHKLSHREPGVELYGPHEHVAEATQAVQDPAVHCGDWAACYEWFRRRCNLHAPDVTPP